MRIFGPKRKKVRKVCGSFIMRSPAHSSSEIFIRFIKSRRMR
jgi:hypothetical protein